MDGNLGRVLVVDDDVNICEVINMYLKSSGYETKIANDGKMAQECFVEFKPDLVLLDMMLPNIDGIDVLKWIRREWYLVWSKPALPLLQWPACQFCLHL